MEDLFKSFAGELEKRKLAKGKMDPDERNDKISALASNATESDTGVSHFDQKALEDHGENEWYSKQGEHAAKYAKMSDADLHNEHSKVFGKTDKKG